MKTPILAANWKMNHGPSAAADFMRTFLAQYPRQYDRTVLFFPSALALHAVKEAAVDRADIQVGVQNIYWADQGAFTGEISAAMARDAGAHLVLVGHSERRHIFGETDEQCAEKCAAAERAGLTPMLCVGETLEQRERGWSEIESVISRQLKSGLSKLMKHEATDMLIAYEPVWAIGTGKNATPEDASAVHVLIREELRNVLGERAGAVHVLYGGSVNPGNAESLLKAPDVDGLLVGGASLDVSSWRSIVQAARDESSGEITA
jgi:triosephosphate isomerase